MCRPLYFYLVLCCLLITGNNLVQCVCKGNSVVLCDKIADLKYESLNLEQCEEVIIGKQGQIPRHNLKNTTFEQINVKEIKVINQIKSSSGFIVVPTKTTKMVLYGNNLTIIVLIYKFFEDFLKRPVPLKHKLDLLCFHHNRIENINLVHCSTDPPTIFLNLCQIFVRKIDLSHNKLKVMKSMSHFCPKLLADELILSHNEIWSIRPSSLPTELRRLHLDHNKFQYVSNINLNSHNLSKLEVLTIAHNKLQDMDDLPIMDTLRHLDLSFNNINHIPQVFVRFKNLVKLNMKSNNLIRFTFPKEIPHNRVYINLAFNRLRNLDLASGYIVHLNLNGNPWNCDCIDKLTFELIKRHYNDPRPVEKYCFRDHLPYCVINQFYGEPCSDEQIDESAFKLFRKVCNQVMTWRKCYPIINLIRTP